MSGYIEKTVSNLIEQDFPNVYKEYGPVFIEFVKKYYEWLETTDNVTYHSRRLMEYGDVDDTMDEFIVYFKEKYLKGIQFETQTNTRQLIKHTLDLYRSKGTERSISLLFALVFGENAEVYYPGDDIFRLSDGDWVKPKYLEVTISPENINFVGKQVIGLNSGATAFVERLIKRKIASKYIEVFYISAINGDFEVDEKLTYNGAVLNDCPFMIGSLTTMDIIDGGSGFSVGDIVKITSNNGVQGKGRVANVSNITGIVDFSLNDGGWGYTANADILVSEKVLTFSNAQTYISYNPLLPFAQFETIKQPLATMQYEYANGTFANLDIIETYYSNGIVSGQGRVLSLSTTNSTAGVLTLSVLSGNLQQNVVMHKQGNAITANLAASGYTDLTATGNLIAWASNLVINVTDVSNTFIQDENVYQYGPGNTVSGQGVVLSYVATEGSNGTLSLIQSNGVFRTDRPLVSSSNGTANVYTFDIKIGVIDIANTFTSTDGNYVYSTTSNTIGTISKISEGSGATFEISNTLLYSEVVRIGTDFVRDYLTVNINAVAYGLSGNASANLSAVIEPALTFANITIGSISSIVSENPGSNYDTAPFIVIYEPYIYPYRRHDYIFNIANSLSNFIEGEIITQSNTGATGIIKSIPNTSILYVKRIEFENGFNTTDIITGGDSLATAVITTITSDDLTLEIGINADVYGNVVTGNGSVTSLRVYDSGFGYVNDELASFTSNDGLHSGRVKLNLQKQGESEGYYRSQGGFLSSNKYLHDGYYYQDYSYDIRSSIVLNKYADMVKQILHVAGTKMFGTYVKKSKINTQLSLTSSTVEIE